MQKSPDSLQIIGVKNAFGSLNDNEKRNLLNDLLKLASYEYVRSDEGPPKDTYRHNFIQYIMPYLIKHYVVATTEYIETCFEIWKLLEKESLGDAAGGTCENDDWFLMAVNLNESYGCSDLFYDEINRKSVFQTEIFRETSIEEVQLVTHFAFPKDQFAFIKDPPRQEVIQLNLKFINLLDLVFSDPENAFIALALFGYFKTDMVKRDEYLKKFMAMFPERKSMQEILTHEEKQLNELFNISVL